MITMCSIRSGPRVCGPAAHAHWFTAASKVRPSIEPMRCHRFRIFDFIWGPSQEHSSARARWAMATIDAPELKDVCGGYTRVQSGGQGIILLTVNANRSYATSIVFRLLRPFVAVP